VFSFSCLVIIIHFVSPLFVLEGEDTEVKVGGQVKTYQAFQPPTFVANPLICAGRPAWSYSAMMASAVAFRCLSQSNELPLPASRYVIALARSSFFKATGILAR
jgi:hypothetical protein